MLYKVVLIGVAGSAGALARYGMAGLVQRLGGSELPWGTLAVNALGCFLAGAFWAFSENHLDVSSTARTAVLVGFMGAFTTFSTFMFETNALARDGEWIFAAGNVLVHIVLGCMLVFLGMAVGRYV
jgi:CrcB protein